jgi:hypothetical protein
MNGPGDFVMQCLYSRLGRVRAMFGGSLTRRRLVRLGRWSYPREKGRSRLGLCGEDVRRRLHCSGFALRMLQFRDLVACRGVTLFNFQNSVVFVRS